MNREHVVLVDEANEVLGTAPKAEVHTAHTPLHRGFSVFLFDSEGNVLLQRRALSKITWPGIWSGSCCGHPALNEAPEAAVARRVAYELGIDSLTNLTNVLPDFRYSCELFGIRENEFCPVFVANITRDFVTNPAEVEEILWLPWTDLVQRCVHDPQSLSEWCVLEVAELEANSSWKSVLGL